MQSLNSFLIALIAFTAGVLFMALANVFRERRRQSHIEFLQFERQHRERIRDSKSIMHRNAYRSLFYCLFLLGVAVLASFVVYGVFPDAVVPDNDCLETVTVLNESGVSESVDEYCSSAWTYAHLYPYIPLLLWVLYTVFAYLRFKRFSNVNGYMNAINKIDEKMVRARKKMTVKKK